MQLTGLVMLVSWGRGVVGSLGWENKIFGGTLWRERGNERTRALRPLLKTF